MSLSLSLSSRLSARFALWASNYPSKLSEWPIRVSFKSISWPKVEAEIESANGKAASRLLPVASSVSPLFSGFLSLHRNLCFILLPETETETETEAETETR